MSQRSQSSSRKRRPLSQLPLEETVTARKKSRGASDSEDSHRESSQSARRAGTVNHMTLKNFMCHSLLEVDFTSNISMVIGKNGSGKSAILTALIVGLGGKANLTNRGSSVKGFIKAGRSSASIEIQLCNEGPWAYKPRVFGKTITIVRNLTASGSGGYKVKSATGEVISQSAKEVHNVAANLNVQVDNPICVLNQDTSRNFLSSNNPKNKFTLFMRATRLETLATEYNNIAVNKDHCQRILEEKKTNFQKLRTEILRLKHKIDSHQSIIDMKDRKFALQRELLWSQVKDVEDEYSAEEKHLQKYEKKLNELMQSRKKQSDEVESLNKEIRNYERQISELKDQLEIQSRPQNDFKQQLRELQSAYNAKRQERQAAQIEIETKTKDAEYLESEIANANENMSKVEHQKKERLKKLEALREKLTGFNHQLDTAQNELFQIKNDIARKQEDETGLKNELYQVDQKIAGEKRSIDALKYESGNVLMLYGRDCPRIKQAIDQNKGKFQHEPRGPLGMYIKLKDKKWAVAAEGYLGAGTLRAWCVDNAKDAQVLRDIFKRVCEQNEPAIITSKFIYQKHNVSRNLCEAPDDCVCLYNLMSIKDPVASNCIVDQRSPENILLIPSDDRAMELMSDRRNVPRNCAQGITIRGAKYYPDPNYKTYAANYHRAQFLQVDTKEHMEALRENVQNLENKKQSIQNQLAALQSDMRRQGDTMRQLEEKIRKVHDTKNHIRREYDELNATAEPEVHNVNFLEKELQEVEKVINEKKAAVGECTEEIKEIKMQISNVEDKSEKLKRSLKGMEERIWPLQEQIKEGQLKLRQISTNDDFDNRRREEFERKLKEVRAQLAVIESSVKSKAKEAQKLGDRPGELRSVVQISSEMSELNTHITRIENESENIDQVSERYQELTDKYSGTLEIMSALIENVKELQAAFESRKKHYKLTENYFITYMKLCFKKILEIRQFQGTLEIDLQEKKLELVVIPQQGSQGLTTTSNLSGGERSFATVAFLYAMWQCMDFPFYFLDEFDVYMDKLNRTKVIEILLHHANSKPDLQFVFLTPQDVSFVTQDNVSILRLEDPERRNV